MPVALSWFIRFTHWGIAIAVLLNLYITEDGEVFHKYLGYAATLLVVCRLVYGLIKKNHRHYPNKAAQAVYVLIWSIVIGLGITGYLMGTDRFWGDETVEKIHELLADSLQLLVVLHLLGMVKDSIKNKRKTWMQMITGKYN